MSKVSPDDIEMSSIFGAIKSNLRNIVLASAVLAGLTYAGLMLIAPKYQSEAELAIVASNLPASSGSGIESITTKMDKEAINTHVRALRSTDILERVADKLALKEKPEFNAALGPVDQASSLLRMIGLGGPRSGESERDRVLNVLRSQLEVYTARESRFIGVRMTSVEPELAANIANAVADTYRTSLATETVTEVDDQQKVIQGKIEKLTPELASLETDVERYRREIDSFKGGTQNIGLNEQQLSDLTGELVKAKGVRGEAEARAKSAREMMKIGSAEALPDVQKSPLIQNLVQQRVRIERQISELSATLLPGHPRMRQLNADLSGLKTQLSAEVGKLVESLEKEAKVAAGREDSIKKSLDDIKAKVAKNAPEEAKLRQLEADAKAKRTELENLRGQLESNRKKLDTRAAPVEVKMISEAQAGSVPIFPKKTSMALLVGVATLIFGTALTVLKALFSGARSGAAMAAPRMHAASTRAEPVLPQANVLKDEPMPAINRVQEIKSQPLLASSPTDVSAVTAMSELVDRLAAKRPEQGGHRTLVTGETETIAAGSEAIALARGLSEKQAAVILINWSTTGEGIEAEAGMKKAPGLAELLAGIIRFDQALRLVPETSVHFIGCGAPLSTVATNIDPDQLNLILDALDEAYDHIVVTSAHDDARMLFEAIQGRFDAGVTVAEAGQRSATALSRDGSFLGFEVTEIDVIRYERPAAAAKAGKRGLRQKNAVDAMPRRRAS